ncbi:MAG: alpha/beta fold hydrolase [Bryobacteraceae bacterium]
MRKKLLIVAAIVLVLLLAAGLALWYWMGKPLYTPGASRALPLDPPAQDANPDFWTVQPGIRIRHFSQGSGPAVLIVHGGPGWPIPEPLPALQPLAARWRFVYYHQRGAGQSTRPVDRIAGGNFYRNMQELDRALGLAAQIADIERIRRILREDRIVVMGHSWGGFMAALYAAEFPEHVRALVLVAPAAMLVMPPPEDLMEKLAAALPPGRRDNYRAFMQRYFDFGALFEKSEAEHRALNAEFARYYRLAAETQGMAVPPETPGVESGGWMVPAMYLGMGRRHDYRPALRAVEAPVLVVHGAADMQPESATRTYVAALPKASLTVIPGAGHFPFADQPRRFTAALAAFLDALPAR